MTEGARELGRQARKLPPKERIELVEDILSSLDRPDGDIDARWVAEVEERLSAVRRGEIKAIPLEEVHAKYRTP